MGLETLRALANSGTRLLLVATGEQKAAAVRDALFGNVWSGCPASFLRLLPNVTVIVDQAAAGCLLGGLLHEVSPITPDGIG